MIFFVVSAVVFVIVEVVVVVVVVNALFPAFLLSMTSASGLINFEDQ